jgi:hypothetical protein
VWTVQLENRTSKSGKPYTALVVYYNGEEYRILFLSALEQKLLKDK